MMKTIKHDQINIKKTYLSLYLNGKISTSWFGIINIKYLYYSQPSEDLI